MIRIAFIGILMLLSQVNLDAQTNPVDTVAMPDIVVMGQSRLNLTHLEPLLVVYNNSPKNIDSLFLGCAFLGSVKRQDSIIVSYTTVKDFLIHAGVPIGEVQIKAPSCVEEETYPLCRVYSNFYRYEKEVVAARLEIVLMIDDSGTRRLIWQRYK